MSTHKRVLMSTRVSQLAVQAAQRIFFAGPDSLWLSFCFFYVIFEVASSFVFFCFLTSATFYFLLYDYSCIHINQQRNDSTKIRTELPRNMPIVREKVIELFLSRFESNSIFFFFIGRSLRMWNTMSVRKTNGFWFWIILVISEKSESSLLITFSFSHWVKKRTKDGQKREQKGELFFPWALGLRKRPFMRFRPQLLSSSSLVFLFFCFSNFFFFRCCCNFSFL